MPPLSGVGVVVVVGAVLGVVVGVQKGEDHPHTPTWQHRLLPALARAPTNTQADAAKINCADVVDGPRDVSELQCVSINWEDFYCNWTLPHNDPPWDTHPYQAQLHYHTDFGRSPECSECSKSPGEYGYGCQCPQECCWWRNGDAYMASEQMAQVVFLVGDNCSFTHTLDTYALVLPDAVQDRQAQSLPNTLDVNVSWTLPSPMGTFSRLAKGGVVYRIDHRLVSTSTWTTAVMERCTERQCVGESVVRVAVVLGLNWWYQQYQVRVRLRSGAANTTLEEDGWWSTWQPLTATTPATVPGGAPSVGADSLQVMVEEPEGREVVLAWRPLPPLLHNGPQFTYHATATSLHTSEVVAAAEVKDTYATFSRLSNTQSYRLEVVAENSEGRSNQTSWVRLGTAASLPPAPLLPVVIFHPQLDLYELRWSEEGEGSMSVASFTVYLCQLLPGVSFTHDEPCTGELFWLAVGNISAVNVSLPQFNLTQTTRSSPGSLRFAVSAQTELETSSGMSWDQCDSPRPYTTTSRPPEDVMVQDVESQWARVSWTVGCEAHAGVVEGVGVYYCQGQHNTTQQCEGNEVWAPWTSTSVDLTNLDEDTSYTVWVHLMYRAGTSQWSSPASLTTQHSALASWVIGVIVAASVLITLTFLLIINFSTRKYLKAVNDIKRQLNLPTGLDNVHKEAESPSQEPNTNLQASPAATASSIHTTLPATRDPQPGSTINQANKKDLNLKKKQEVKAVVVEGGRGWSGGQLLEVIHPQPVTNHSHLTTEQPSTTINFPAAVSPRVSTDSEAPFLADDVPQAVAEDVFEDSEHLPQLSKPCSVLTHPSQGFVVDLPEGLNAPEGQTISEEIMNSPVNEFDGKKLGYVKEPYVKLGMGYAFPPNDGSSHPKDKPEIRATTSDSRDISTVPLANVSDNKDLHLTATDAMIRDYVHTDLKISSWHPFISGTIDSLPASSHIPGVLPENPALTPASQAEAKERSLTMEKTPTASRERPSPGYIAILPPSDAIEDEEDTTTLTKQTPSEDQLAALVARPEVCEIQRQDLSSPPSSQGQDNDNTGYVLSPLSSGEKMPVFVTGPHCSSTKPNHSASHIPFRVFSQTPDEKTNGFTCLPASDGMSKDYIYQSEALLETEIK